MTENSSRRKHAVHDILSYMGTAYLSNEGRYTVFQYGDERIRFIGPYSLDHYVSVNTWDDGCLAVMTKYAHSDDLIEEYIDLRPILQNLNFDSDVFLQPIERVEVLS